MSVKIALQAESRESRVRETDELTCGFADVYLGLVV